MSNDDEKIFRDQFYEKDSDMDLGYRNRSRTPHHIIQILLSADSRDRLPGVNVSTKMKEIYKSGEFKMTH